MGMDFLALIARRPGRDLRKDLEALEVAAPHGVQDLATLLRSMIGEPRFAEARPHSAGRAAVRAADGKWGFVDLEGRLVIECTFDAVSDFCPDGVARVELRRRVGYIDLLGAYLWRPVD
ncbi:MAG: WG repeat-containing protein [Planctomycetes bacterium]|nr:WG repeat-containing protein [Planctomycetota bacterium]